MGEAISYTPLGAFPLEKGGERTQDLSVKFCPSA